MTANNETRAYIVQATPETMDAIASKLLPVSDRAASVAIGNAAPLDLDALREVLEAAGHYSALYARDYTIDDAISKIEKLLK